MRVRRPWVFRVQNRCPSSEEGSAGTQLIVFLEKGRPGAQLVLLPDSSGRDPCRGGRGVEGVLRDGPLGGVGGWTGAGRAAAKYNV